MQKVVEILRLRAAGLSARQIAHSCGIARSTVGEHLARFRAAGLSWPLAPELSEEELEKRLFAAPIPTRTADGTRPQPEWPAIHRELSKKGVTLRLLWKEYREGVEDGYRYSQFCERYRQWTNSLELCMRQTYRAGEKLFVDFSGLKFPVVDSLSGQEHEAEIFVAALGLSHYLYAQATRSQKMADWIDAHVRTYEYLQGVPEITVSDNLKSAVVRACRYDPQMNLTYQDMARHYGTATMPARARSPRDNAKAESAVRVIQQEVLAPLRHQRFFSLGELNVAIGALVKQINERTMQKLDISRRAIFIAEDQPALKPLPATRYEYAEFRKVRVNIDYHVEIHRHYYSVPYALKGQQLYARVTARMVEVLHNGHRVATHLRDCRKGRHSTEKGHMPRAHQEYLAWTPSRILGSAAAIGLQCAQAARQIIESRDHPQQGYRAAMGIVRLAKRYPAARVEAACQRALALDVCNYQSINSILRSGKDQEAVPNAAPIPRVSWPHHQNVRGSQYYAQQKPEERPQVHAQ